MQKATVKAAFMIKAWRRSEILSSNPSVKTKRLIVSTHSGAAGGQVPGFPFFKRFRRLADENCRFLRDFELRQSPQSCSGMA